MMKKLLSFQRLRLDIFKKLNFLKEEDDSGQRTTFMKKLKDQEGYEEENFFLDEDLKPENGFHELKLDQEGECEN